MYQKISSTVLHVVSLMLECTFGVVRTKFLLLKFELKSIRAISISVESKGETFFSEIAATKRYLPF